MFKHLFVPVDGSDLSHRAMEGSIDLAKSLGARITGFVVEPDLPLSTISNFPDASSGRMKAHETANKNHSDSLLNQFRARAVAAGISFDGLTVTAYGVDHAIMEEAERTGCDLIVMVTHGRGTVGQFLFGSHTQKIVARSKLPVLVLH